jgi:hypothetical protein
MKRIWSSLNELWCKSMHPAPMWPVHGYYRCPACHRHYPVLWEAREPARPTHKPEDLGRHAGQQTAAKSRGSDPAIAAMASR